VTLAQARADDLQYAEPKDLALLNIFFANGERFIDCVQNTLIYHLVHIVIAKLGKKLELRQQVIATATVFLRRFYLRSSYCETDPFFVAAACCYLAAKTEETPVHLKSVVSEARSLFSCEQSPSSSTKTTTINIVFHSQPNLESELSRAIIRSSAKWNSIYLKI
jgi:cyclin C